MARAIHVIDRHVGPDALEQYTLLRRGGDELACIGPPPELLRGLRAPCAPPAPILAAWALRRQLAGAEVVHAWSPQAACLLGAAGRGRPLVVSVESVPRGAALRALRRCAHAGAAIAAWSASLKGSLQEAGIDCSRFALLPPANVVIDLPLRRRRLREALRLADDVTVIAAPAPATANSGQKLAIWMQGILGLAGYYPVLLLPSRGPWSARVRYFCRRARPDAPVVEVDEPFGAPDLVAAGDLGLVPALGGQGWSAMAWALAAAMPTVAADVPALAELAGGAALLVEPAKARPLAEGILGLLGKPDARRTLSDAARRRANELGFDQAARRLDDLYAMVMRRSPL